MRGDDDDENDDDLFNYTPPTGGGRARTTDPDTSHDAANADAVSFLQQRYLLALYQHSPVLSTTAIARYWEMGRDSFSPRSKRLLEIGLISCVGKQMCESFSGKMRHMQHYQLTDAGRTYVKTFLLPNS
jgi:hypothetical protein